MERKSWLQRLSSSSSITLAIVAGWFLHSLLLLPGSSSYASNIPLSSVPQPISFGPTKSLSPMAPGQDRLAASSPLLQQTQNLRPGRGDPIPTASSVHELSVVDVSFYNWRGERLSGWLGVTTPQAPVIILAHGSPGNRTTMVQRAAFLYKYGYNVLLFDFQSYGLSQGSLSTLGMVESEDVLAAISYLRGLPDLMYSKIGVLGLSMGATAAILAASRSNDIAALVAESCPVDATRVPGDVPDDQTRDADRKLVEQVYGVDITQARPLDVVAKLAGHSAIFFINGDNDTTTPLAGMQALYQAAGQPKQSWVVSGAGHAESFNEDSVGYIAHVDAFFDAYLRT